MARLERAPAGQFECSTTSRGASVVVTSIREGLGIPVDAHFISLLYSPPAEMMLVHAEMAREPFRIARLFGKGLNEDAYRELTPGQADETVQDPVACPVTPTAYFTWSALEKHQGPYTVSREGQAPEWQEGETTAGWIKGVFRLDLLRGQVTPVVEYAIRKQQDVWVSSLHSVAPDGGSLLCSAAFYGRSADGSGSVGYFLSKLDVGSGVLTQLAPLRAVFY
jgi:hypothetical protein